MDSTKTHTAVPEQNSKLNIYVYIYFFYLFIYLTLPINMKTQKNTYMDNGREHATAYANYSGPYI